ncbi:unnamed protein product [Larinioides sclopetarius]|uniref:C2H2-type domain-containing protein n=1 Tax=Larinioides sclopetarius TaxID=280406 RepID=A0AAV2AB11_9ARAC
MGASDSLRSSRRKNAGLKSHQCVSCSTCMTYEKHHYSQLKNHPLTSDSKTKRDKGKRKDKFCERSEETKKTCTLEIHKDRKGTDKSKTKLNVRSLKGNYTTNKIDVCGIFDSRNFESTDLANGGVNQPVGSVPTGDLKAINSVQARTIKKKRKGPKDDKFCKKFGKMIANYTLEVHKRCAEKSKFNEKVLKPKVNCNQTSSRYVKGKGCKNKKNCDETLNKSLESSCLMNDGVFLLQPNILLRDIKEPTNNASDLSEMRSTEPSVTEDMTFKSLNKYFLDGPFWQQLTSTANTDFQNEFRTNFNTVKHIVLESIEKISQNKDAFEMECRYGMDVTLNDLNEDLNIFSEESISHFGFSLLDASVGLGSEENKETKSNKQPFDISSAIIPFELTSACDAICNEKTSVTCEEQNPFSNNCNAFDTNNSASDELNQSIPLLLNEQLNDLPAVLDHSDMPELSIMDGENFDLENTISQTFVDLHQNSCVRSAETECISKHSRIVNIDDSIKPENQTVPQESGISGNAKINLDDLIHRLYEDYDECLIVEKSKKVANERYKCGKCCKLFELKTGHLHKTCDVNIRTVIIDNLNFICMKCCALLENLDVLSSHKEKCQSANKSVINKSKDLNVSGCSKSPSSVDKTDLISIDNILKGNYVSNASYQNVKDQNSLIENPQNSISTFICPQCKKQIIGKHAQEQHHCKTSIFEYENSSASDDVLSKVLSSNIQNNLSMKSNMDLGNSQCKLTNPITADFASKSGTFNSEMSSFIANMAERGLCSPNKGAKFSVPLSYKSMSDMLSYFLNLGIKKEENESGPNQLPSTPETCINCKKPLHFEMPAVDDTCLSIYCNNPLYLDLPCSVCKHLYPVVIRKDILNILTRLLDKFKNVQEDTLQGKQIDVGNKIKEENSETILPRIEQVVTISSDDFFYMNESDTTNPTENSFQQIHSDPLKQKIVQNVNINMNSSVTNPVVPHSLSIPEQVESASLESCNLNMNSSVINPAIHYPSSFPQQTENTAFTSCNVNLTRDGSIASSVGPLHSPSMQEQIQNTLVAYCDDSSVSIQEQIIIPSEIILENDFFSEPDLYMKDSDPDNLTYICGECFSSLMREQIAKHFYENHETLKNKFNVADASS